MNKFIYIYICIFRQHFFVNANFIKHNRHFMSTYFLLDPFEFPYYFYCILGELIYMQLWTIHKSIPPEYNKSNTGIRTDPKENM